MIVRVNKDDYVYKSKAGFFHVWKRKNDYGVYNDRGVLIVIVPRPQDYGGNIATSQRALDMASLCQMRSKRSFNSRETQMNIGPTRFTWIGLAEVVLNPPTTNDHRYRIWRERWNARFQPVFVARRLFKWQHR